MNRAALLGSLSQALVDAVERLTVLREG
jgi:hypothetical protein